MLQIVTEKFFPPGERYEKLHRAAYYTNCRVMRGVELVTPVGSLLAVIRQLGKMKWSRLRR
jgi:hypothetical protein